MTYRSSYISPSHSCHNLVGIPSRSGKFPKSLSVLTIPLLIYCLYDCCGQPYCLNGHTHFYCSDLYIGRSGRGAKRPSWFFRPLTRCANTLTNSTNALSMTWCSKLQILVLSRISGCVAWSPMTFVAALCRGAKANGGKG